MTDQTRLNWRGVAGTFLEFFGARDHVAVPSASLVPAGDPTLLFTNAGMVQFKDVFLGRERRAYTRAATLQKCMRVQGKHNDLENVGPSPRHHTFFLMLGNFSFGDYFKREAIAYAWELVTRQYAIDPSRLIVTVHTSDDDAAAAWRAMEVPQTRVLRLGDPTNFWMMADVGPCGPTSELHYDWGPQHCTCHRPDCSVALDNGCLRWLEIWNLVFMQFDQHADGTRGPLPKPGVDTGMGLERISSVLQGVNDDYGTDLFTPLMDRLQRILGHTDRQREAHAVAYRVMADHGRAMTFLMADGVVPGNEGRNYVLRMIMRRAMRFGRAAGLTRSFLAELAGTVTDAMGDAYPELRRQQSFIESAVRQEEERFAQTLTGGLQRLEELISDGLAASRRELSGEEVFRLYDTFGFPVEMTRDIARERGLTIDEAGFARAMEAQRSRARAAQAFGGAGDDRRYAQVVRKGGSSEFVGYTKHAARARIVALFAGGEAVSQADAGAEVEVILDRTPFYAESGGQVGDTGLVRAATGAAEVIETHRPLSGVIVHRCRVTTGRLRVGQPVRAEINAPRRWDIMRNHTATHLLHQALREVLGEHARQAGSLVAPDRLRFDFVHLAALTPQQRDAVERGVNEQILADLPVRARWMSYAEATRLGAMALFGEKYGDRVRVISIDGYSRELCGGTHLSRTGQMGLFKITSEGGVAAGVRRIEAVTGRGAYDLVSKHASILDALSKELNAEPEALPGRIKRLEDRVAELERQLRTQLRDRAVDADHTLDREDGLKVRGSVVAFSDPGQLRTFADGLRRAAGDRVLAVVGSESTGQVVVLSSDPAIHAGRFVEALTKRHGGGGGGHDKMGQGGVKDPSVVRALVKDVVTASVLDDLITAARKSA